MRIGARSGGARFGRQVGQGNAGLELCRPCACAETDALRPRRQLSQRVVKAGGTVLGGCRRAPAGRTTAAARSGSASHPFQHSPR